uniref:SGNH hydrolase-type esterase domain-containing protein n=1 Tax=Glycine max TaxID=3847 RepID=K7M775_SOYBN
MMVDEVNLQLNFAKIMDATNQQSLVIVYFGGNDSMHRHLSGLSPHVPLQEYIENMKKIVIHLKPFKEDSYNISQFPSH